MHDDMAPQVKWAQNRFWGPSSCPFLAPFVLKWALFRHVFPPTGGGVRVARPRKISWFLSTSPFPWFVTVHNLGHELSSFSTIFHFFFFFLLFFALFCVFMVLPTWVVGK